MNLSKGTFPSEIIIISDNAKNSEAQKRSVKSYASGVFQESTIGIVSNIVATHSRARKCFKSLLLMLCITGFLYQCITYLTHVFEYPTVVDLEVKRPKKFYTPAYTFCSNNGMKRSVFCEMYPDNCFEPSKEFCSRYPSYCGRNKTLVPKRENYKLENTMSYEDILKYGDNLNEFVVEPKRNSTDVKFLSGPYIRVKQYESDAMICYGYNSALDGNKMPEVRSGRDFSFQSKREDKLIFYVDDKDIFLPGNRPGVLFSIHSQYEAVNPFIKGIFMKPGRTYKIYITMTEEVLLEAPYQTECLDYEEMWKTNNFTGPRIQSMCEQQCMLRVSMKCFNCSLPSIVYPHNERICYFNDLEGRRCSDEAFDIMFSCLVKCEDDCRNTKYSSETMWRHEVNYDETIDQKELKKYITVEIFIEDGEVITLKYSPKYLTVEMFSAVGGFIGVWLGISLMDIIDVLFSVFTVSRYAIRKYSKNPTNSRFKQPV